MPITKSAIKRMRQNLKRNHRNVGIKNAVKSEVKALRTAIAEGNEKVIAERLAAAQSKLDKATKAGVIHKNKAARQKSQLVKSIKAGAAAPAKAEAKKPAAKPAEKPAKAPAEPEKK